MRERSFESKTRENFKPDPTLRSEVAAFLEHTKDLPEAEPAVQPEIIKPETQSSEIKPAQPDYSKPPKLERVDMENVDGDIVDFSQAKNYHELIEMITREGVIKNKLGQELAANQVINLIYKLTYQDLNNFQKADWTNITLRHRLRETVAKLIYEYKKTDEFRALAGLDLSGARSIEEIIDLVAQKLRLIDAQGNIVGSELIIDHIKRGNLHLLPEPIRYKVIELNNVISEEHINQSSKKSLLNRAGKLISKFKFWGK